MPKRIQMAPLPEDHDEMLTLWAWGKRRSRSAMSAHVVEARIEANNDLIIAIIERAAKRRGISYEEMKARVLANPRYDWDDTQPEDPENL